MGSVRVLLADDHRVIAEAVKEYVARTFDVVGTVGDGVALVEAARALQPDVVVADISMPRTDGLTAMKQLQQHLPHVRVILLTNYGDAALVRHALEAGASGFVLKPYALTDLVPAIQTVFDGGTYVSSALDR